MIRAIWQGVTLTGQAVSMLTGEVRGMHAAAYILGLSSLVSSLLALFRDRLLAHTFGAGVELDLYYAAFRIPDLLFVVLGTLVSVYVLIPVLASRDEAGQRDYIDTVIVGFSMFSVVASLIAAIFAPYLLGLFFPSLVFSETLTVLTLLTRILLLQPILLGLSNIVAAITQFKHRYALYAVAPVLYNVGIIIGIMWLYPEMGLTGLVFGVVLGAALHVSIQLPAAIGDGFFRRIPRLGDISELFRTVRVSIPRALALSMSQIAFLGLVIVAGALPTGSISIFMFAFNLQAVPLSIIGASYSVAAFPTLATLSRNGSTEFLDYVATAARHVLFWSMPVLALMIILRAHVVRTVLGSGAFDWTDTRLTAAAFALFAFSLAAQGITLLLVRAYYAKGVTVVPLAVAAGTAATTLVGSVIFLSILQNNTTLLFVEAALRVEDMFGSEILALPLAYSLAAVVGVTVLVFHFNRHNPGFVSATANSFWESITAAFFGGAAAYGTLVVLGTVTLSSTLASVLLRGGAAGIIGIAVAALTYYVLGNREFSETVQALQRRLWRDAEPVSSGEGAETGIPRS